MDEKLQHQKSKTLEIVVKTIIVNTDEKQKIAYFVLSFFLFRLILSSLVFVRERLRA